MTSSRGCVRWRGVNATYSRSEREIMAALPVKEQAFVHTLKSFTDGEIQETGPIAAQASNTGRGGLKSIPPASPVYTDPEDLEFGKPKRRPKIYGLVATPKLACQVKTKAEAEFWTKVWRKWYELKGWIVYGSVGCYIAANEKGDRHAISLHTYDRETLERL